MTDEKPIEQPKDERKPPYPEFCCHPQKCIEAGRCARTVHGEPWCCND